MSQGRATYTQAFREAQERAPSVAATYNHGVKLADVDTGELRNHAERFAARADDDDGDVDEYADDTEQVAITVIANLVTGMPRPASYEIDWANAVDAVNAFVDEDVRIQAADEFLQGLADKGTDTTRDEIDAEHEALAAVALTGEYDEESLEDLLYQFVR